MTQVMKLWFLILLSSRAYIIYLNRKRWCLSSNHFPVVFDIGSDYVINTTETLDYVKVDWKTFRTLLDQKLVLTNSTINAVTNINAAIAFVTETIFNGLDLMIPKVSYSHNKLKLPHRATSSICQKNHLKWQTFERKIVMLRNNNLVNITMAYQ